MTKFTLVLVAIGFALFVGAAKAATIDDLRALGYTVSIANPGPDGQNCPVYYIAGHGVGEYVNCNSQDVIDSLANPATICNADWQANHPDQLAAVQTIRQQGWSVTGDQCADTYTVSNPNTGEQVYTGPGAGLVNLDPGVPAAAAPAPSAPGGNPAPSPDPNQGQCLPLCATPPTVTTAAPAPAAPTPEATTTTATASSTTAAPVNVTVNVTVNQAAQAAQEPTVTQGTNRLLASVITIAAKQTVIFTTKTHCRIKIVVVPCWKVYPQIAAARKITLLGRPGLGGVAVTSLTITP